MRSGIRLNEGEAMPVSETDLDLTATDVSEESWEMLVAEMASDDPDVLYIMQNPVASLGCSCTCEICCGPSGCCI
jgi:hypothetical protein